MDYISTIIAMNDYIRDKEQGINQIFIKEANRMWDKGETHINSYPLFITFYTDLLWKEYVGLN